MSDDDGVSGEEQWICARCSAELMRSGVRITYLGNSFSVELHVCPGCGSALVTEDVAMKRMAEAERILEDK